MNLFYLMAFPQIVQYVNTNPCDWESFQSTIMDDKDTTLFEAFQTGVSTGFNHDIPPSNCFPTNDRQPDASTILSAHLCNWASAEADMELTRTLVE